MLFSGFSFRNDAWAITIKTTREPRTFGRTAYCYSCQKEKDIFFVHFAGFLRVTRYSHAYPSCLPIGNHFLAWKTTSGLHHAVTLRQEAWFFTKREYGENDSKVGKMDIFGHTWRTLQKLMPKFYICADAFQDSWSSWRQNYSFTPGKISF